MLTDNEITHVYFNEATDPDYVQRLLNERQVDQTARTLTQITEIGTIKHQAQVLSVELNFFRESLFADLNEKDIHSGQDTEEAQESSTYLKYDEVCLGGTFDHMHLGHKLLLTQACMVTNKVLHVGVTSSALLVKKKYAEHMESWEKRCHAVESFLKRLRPSLKVVVFELQDPVGIAGWSADLSACVLT